MTDLKNKRVLSGMRPTGRLHIGHLEGVLTNWLRCQREGAESYFFVADWHAITDKLQEDISPFTIEMVKDWLAVGIDPEKSVIFVQSWIKQHAELSLLLGMMTPVPWLERVPTYKDYVSRLTGEDKASFGMLGYPVLQAADILVYQTDYVPVGDDQLAHLEVTREISRRVNNFIGNVFKEPEPLLTKSPRLPGTDGRKMSKSYQNTIELTDEGEPLKKKIMRMMTDPARKRKTDPGDPDKCPVYEYQKIYNTEHLEHISAQCRTAGWGCTECKGMMLEKVEARLQPIREKRKTFKGQEEKIVEILKEGTKKAATVAEETLINVRKQIGFLAVH